MSFKVRIARSRHLRNLSRGLQAPSGVLALGRQRCLPLSERLDGRKAPCVVREQDRAGPRRRPAPAIRSARAVFF